MSLSGYPAGDMNWGRFSISAYIYLGAFTPTTVFVGGGVRRSGFAYDSSAEIGDMVELFDDAALTALATGMVPVVRPLATVQDRAFVGRIIELLPPTNCPRNAVSGIASQLAAKCMMKATIEFAGLVGVTQLEVTVPMNGGGADAITIGDPSCMSIDISEDKWVHDTGSLNTWVPLHHIAGLTDADVAAPILAAIGMQPIEVITSG